MTRFISVCVIFTLSCGALAVLKPLDALLVKIAKIQSVWPRSSYINMDERDLEASLRRILTLDEKELDRHSREAVWDWLLNLDEKPRMEKVVVPKTSAASSEGSTSSAPGSSASSSLMGPSSPRAHLLITRTQKDSSTIKSLGREPKQETVSVLTWDVIGANMIEEVTESTTYTFTVSNDDLAALTERVKAYRKPGLGTFSLPSPAYDVFKLIGLSGDDPCLADLYFDLEGLFNVIDKQPQDNN
jgi:hypothetical protein